jgi:hypothetical protein
MNSMKNSVLGLILWTYDPYKVECLQRRRHTKFSGCDITVEHSSEVVRAPALCLECFDLNLNWKNKCFDRFFTIFFSISRHMAG